MTQLILSTIELNQFGELIESSVRKVLSEEQNSKPPQDERLTRHEACALYKISLPTIHKHMNQGLPYEKIGRKTLFRREQLDNYFRSKQG